jgi:hypothetical protein
VSHALQGKIEEEGQDIEMSPVAPTTAMSAPAEPLPPVSVTGVNINLPFSFVSADGKPHCSLYSCCQPTATVYSFPTMLLSGKGVRVSFSPLLPQGHGSPFPGVSVLSLALHTIMIIIHSNTL